MRSLDGHGWAKSVEKAASGALLLALGTWVSGYDEAAVLSAASSTNSALRSSFVSARPAPAEGRILREIRDPHSGACWLLVRDESHPGGPGRLVPAGESPIPVPPNPRAQNRADGPHSAGSSDSLAPVIRAGDRLIVEEKTSVVEAHLEAVALGPAAVGGVFGVRLRIGGRALRAVALGPGRAALQAAWEVRP